jgi:acyl-homoserine lactone acylase PvdQ
MFIEALQQDAKSPLYDIAQTVSSGGSLSAAQEPIVVSAVSSAYETTQAIYGRVEITYGDRHRIARGGQNFPVGGGAVMIGGSVLNLDQDGARIPHPTILAALRAMAFEPDPADRRYQLVFCCQRVPFVVAFHPGKRLTSYSQLLPGISDDPASPHYDDQIRLASDGALRPNDFYLDELLKDAESSTELDIPAPLSSTLSR